LGTEGCRACLVNNWANGWEISDQWSVVSDQSELETDNQKPITIAIIYLPQLLEHLGFLLMGGAFVFVVKCKYD